MKIPQEVNYIAVFLTLRCNLKCAYCINRQGGFKIPSEMTTDLWIKGLSRLETRNDLPISLQGGEPTIYPGFYTIVNELYRQGKHMDLLTNGNFDMLTFMNRVPAGAFKRKAKYASIRFSYHKGMNPLGLAFRVWALQNEGYEVGIWGIDCVDNKFMKLICKRLKIDFRIKQYLDNNHGTYKYLEGLNGIPKNASCKTSELIIGPSGSIFKCHADLYNNRYAIGHILDENLPDFIYRDCANFGNCNPCDLKLKTNRFQEYGHCSVDIKC